MENFSVTKNGRPLDKDLYTFDEEARTFSSEEGGLVIDAGFNFTIKAGSCCTIDAGFNCIIDTGDDCVIIRRDIFEVIQPEPNQKIKLNGFGEKGYTIVEDNKTITIDGKDITISNESFEELKKQLLND